MSADQNKYAVPHLIGAANLPRDTNPAIRGTIRREDPDANPEPHWTGLSGTSLELDYSPTGAQTINFVSDNLDDAISAINAVDVANLEAVDSGGYLRLRNLNGGDKNYLKITGGDAAPILGFRVDPLPGSASYAGEISTAPPGRIQGQNNSQGTALLAGDEDLSSSSINRAIIGSLLHAERLAADLDLETTVAVEVSVTVQLHPVSGEKCFHIQDPSLRIPIRGFGVATSSPASGDLDDQMLILEVIGGQSKEVIDPDAADTFGRIINVYYDDLTNTLNNAGSFIAWGTPDGRSIFGTAGTLEKQVATAITSIDADVITVTGATFQTLDCQPGDTVLIAGATNTTPFSHNGEFIILEVLGEEIVRVRPKSYFDTTFSSSEKPRGLNEDLPGGTSYGNLSVLIGDYISASDLVFEIEASTLAVGTHAARLLVGKKVQETRLPTSGAQKSGLFKSNTRMAELLRVHAVTAAGLRHGADHIDAPAVAGSPDSLTAGTVEAQLAELLGHVNNLIAGQVTYGGGVAWADGTTNPSTDLESQVDKILNDLVSSTGSAKLNTAAGPNWADGTTNPQERLDERIDSIISDLAGGAVDGPARIQAQAVGDLLIGTLRAQLNQIDTEWLRLSRTNTVSATQTFSTTQILNPAADADPALQSTTVPAASSYRLMWELATGTDAKIRLYVGETGGFVLTHNAEWDDHGSGLRWQIDTTPDDIATMMRLSQGYLEVSYVNTAQGGPYTNGWTDATWREILEIDLSTLSGQGAFEVGKDLIPGNDVDQSDVPSLGNLASFADIWKRVVAQHVVIGTYAEDHEGKALAVRGEKGAANGWAGEYISKYMGLWSRKGFRIEEEFWVENQFSHLEWIAFQSGSATTFSYPTGVHIYRLGHTGVSAGTNGLRLDPAHIRYRLTDGVIVRCRINFTRVSSTFTTVEIGFYDAATLTTNELSLVIDLSGFGEIEFHVGSSRTVVATNNDFPAAGLRWYTFCLVGSTLSWVIDTAEPDPDTLVGGSTDSQSGSATISVPTGQSQFAFKAHGDSGGEASEMDVDFIEVIAGDRE